MPLLSKSSQLFFQVHRPINDRTKITKNRHGPASHDLQIKLMERDNKKYIGLSTDAQLHKTQKFRAVDFQSCNVAGHGYATTHQWH